MALTEAFITQEKRCVINTSAGQLYFPVFYIDSPVNVGDEIWVHKYTNDEIWKPYTNPRSVWGSPGTVYTPFVSSGGAIRGSVNSEHTSLTVRIFSADGRELEASTIGSFTSQNCRCPTYPFFIGSNGVPYCPSRFASAESLPITGDRVSYTPNTANSFGIYMNLDFTGSSRHTITQDMIDKAVAILNDSSIGREDPFQNGGNTTPGGGTGDFDGTGDKIGKPTKPTLSAVDAGFITIFNPTVGQLQNLASYMWGSLFDISSWKKLFADPMQCILGLSIVPVAVPNGGTKPVTVGNISTGINMTVAASQYVDLDCGTLNVNEFWGAYLDYDPFTSVDIYLPYIGMRTLKADDIMGTAVNVYYWIDILSGACTATISCDDCALYTFTGQCSASVPISGNDWTNVVNGAISAAAALPAFVSGIAGAAEGALTAGAAAGAANLATSVFNSKPHVEKSGTMSSTGGMLGIQTPFLILTRPRQAVPQYQASYTGYPSFITRGLSQLGGYTIVENIHLQNIPATDTELDEIERILKTGVIL